MTAIPLIDTNAWVDYPLDSYSFDGGDPRERLRALATLGIHECWVGSFAALFADDPTPANDALLTACRRVSRPRCLPAPTVNPLLPSFPAELARYAASGVRVIRIYPPAHGYRINEPAFDRLVHEAARRGILVQVVCSIEDPRTQPPTVRWPALEEELTALPGTTSILLLNVPGRQLLRRLAAAKRVSVDIAMPEGTGVVERLIAELGRERVLFGTYTPVFYSASSVLKLIEAALPEDTLRCVASRNARRLLTR